MTYDLYGMTDKSIIEEIGKRIKKERISQNVSQAEVAKAAGTSVFTISSIENGKKCTLTSLLQILRALQCLDLISNLLDDDDFSPIKYAEMQRNEKQRQRSSKKQ